MAKEKKKKSANLKWGIALLVEIIVIVAMGYAYFRYYINDKVSEIQVVEIKEENLQINEGSNEAQKGYTTIALFGIDARSTDSLAEGNRSDSIIIASINNDTKEVRLVSVYRDTLLRIANGNDITSKVNAAYSYGGPELAIATLNENLDLQITDFVTVNFTALTKAIDDLGGITVNVKDSELSVLNSAITEQIEVTGIYSDGVWTTGEVLLNGTQATAYARVRSTDQGDITRTQRQRYVIGQMIAKAKKSDLATIDKIIDDVFPSVLTSMNKKEIVSLAENLMNYNLGSTTGFPMAVGNYTTETKGACLAPADLTENVSKLHEFLFDTVDYTPTETVQQISSALTSETGIGYSGQEIEIDTKLLNYDTDSE
jgi:LCP family protein required for cell wall assembly